MGIFADLFDCISEISSAAVDSIVETVDEAVVHADRRIDAIFGRNEYENATLIDKSRCLAGMHDDGAFEKSKNRPTHRQPGDVIGVSRGTYDHYGICLPGDNIIHYSSKVSDTGSDNRIIKTSFSAFLRGEKKYFFLTFPDRHGCPNKTDSAALMAAMLGTGDSDLLRRILSEREQYKNYRIYSPEETMERAHSRLGEDAYNMFSNNCEHFAIWCKTGISESYQAERILSILKPNPVIVN